MGEIRIIEISFGSGPSYIKNGPKCYCEHNDWIVKADQVTCSWDNRSIQGRFTGYVKDGPKCYCEHSDWFVSSEHWVCTWCKRER